MDTAMNLDKLLVAAHYALEDATKHGFTKEYNDAYETAMLEALAHQHYNEFTVDARLASFKQNASTDNWCILCGAMAVYQYATKNIGKD